MKKLFGIILVVSVIALCGCSNSSKTNHAYAGKFMTEDSIRFELNGDSTTLLIFPDGTTYNSKWKIVENGDDEWVNIEFAGNQAYYYLKNGKIYRSRRQMDNDSMGLTVTYED